MPLNDLVRSLADYVEQELAEGRASIEVGPETASRVKSLRGSAPRRTPPPSPAVRPSALRQAAVERPPATPAERARPDAPHGQPTAHAAGGLEEVARVVAKCRKCSLHESRTRTVPGQGCLTPDILFVGEAPGAEEDQQGLAFVGAAGQLLTRMIVAMGLTRDQVFIANILKCRPPNNRTPLPEEMDTCLPYLKEQIALLEPKVIVALGATATRGLLGRTEGITRLRGHWLTFQEIPTMPTFHPAYLLRNPAAKREAWEDLKAVLNRLGRTPPPVTQRPD